MPPLDEKAGTPLTDAELGGTPDPTTDFAASLEISSGADDPFAQFHEIAAESATLEAGATPEGKPAKGEAATPKAEAPAKVSAVPDDSEAIIERVLEDARLAGKEPNAALKSHLKTVLAERQQPAVPEFINEFGGEDVVKQAAEFYQTYLNPSADVRSAYNKLASADGERMVDMWTVAAESPQNRDIFAKLATGNMDVDAASLAQVAQIASIAPPDRIAQALHVLEQVEAGADLDDLDFDPNAKAAGEKNVDPEVLKLRQELEIVQTRQQQEELERVRTEIKTRKTKFEKTLEHPIDAELGKADFAELDSQFKQASGLPFGVSDMIRHYVQSMLVNDPAYAEKFNSALHHSLRPDGADAANTFLPALLTGAKNLTVSAVEGINSFTRGARGRTAEIIKQIEGEPRLSGSASAGAAAAYDDPMAKFNARTKAGMDPFEALSQL